MRKRRTFFRHVLALMVCAVALLGGILYAGADEKPSAAKKVAAGWKHPDAKANSGSSGSGDGTTVGETFRVPRPFAEVWQFYAKKCGYRNPLPGKNATMAVDGSGQCVMLYEDSTSYGGGVSSAFSYHDDAVAVSVSLVDRKDGVRVFLLVAAK